MLGMSVSGVLNKAEREDYVGKFDLLLYSVFDKTMFAQKIRVL